MEKKYSDIERTELNNFSDTIKRYSPVFKFSPNINKTLVIIYWEIFKERDCNVDDLDRVLSSLAIKIDHFPSLLELQEELNIFISKNRQQDKIKTYSVISESKVNACNGDKRIVLGRYLSHSLNYTISEDKIDSYISQVRKSIEFNKLFYEIAYCKLCELGIINTNDFPSPEMTMPKIWRFCGLIITENKKSIPEIVQEIESKWRM